MQNNLSLSEKIIVEKVAAGLNLKVLKGSSNWKIIKT